MPLRRPDDLRPDPRIGEDLQKDAVGDAAVEHVDLPDPLPQGRQAALHLRDHPARDRAGPDRGGRLVLRHRRDAFPLRVQHAGHVRQQDELLRRHRSRHLRRRRVPVDVVDLSGRAHADRGDDGDESVLLEGPEDSGDHLLHLPHQSQIERFARRAASRLDLPGPDQPAVLAAKPDRLAAELVDERHDPLVHRAAQDHLDHFHRRRRGDPQAFLPLGGDGQQFEHPVDLGAAAVHHHGADPDILEEHDVLGERRHAVVVLHRRPAVFHHDGLPGELPDVRQGLDQRLGLLDIPLHVPPRCPAQRMYRLRSASRTIPASLSSTYGLVTTTFCPAISGAVKSSSSSSRSITVWSLRAPMFSVRSFTSHAISAIRSTAPGSKERATPSAASIASYCRVSAPCGSVRIRTNSSFPREASSTRMGNRPWSSGMRSEGLLTWNAPAAMNRMKSVRTTPCLVLTLDPSTIGSRSLCTPCRDTSGPERDSRPAILSISSRNTIPDCSVRSTASRFTRSMSTRRPASSFSRNGRASGTRIRFRRTFFGKSPESISWRFPSIPSGAPPAVPRRSITGTADSRTSTSTVRSASFPSRSRMRRRSRVSREALSVSPARGGTGGSSRSRRRSSAAARARSATFSISSARTMWTAISTRSRTIDSTSRPTYPTSVNLDASTLRKGAWASFARRRAISVFPTPVGPAMMMFFGAISSRSSGATRMRRHRFRRAIATALLAAACPTMYRSSSETISRGISGEGTLPGGSCVTAPRSPRPRHSRSCRRRCRRRSPPRRGRSPRRKAPCGASGPGPPPGRKIPRIRSRSRRRRAPPRRRRRTGA